MPFFVSFISPSAIDDLSHSQSPHLFQEEVVQEIFGIQILSSIIDISGPGCWSFSECETDQLVKISWGMSVCAQVWERVYLLCPTFSRSRCSQVQIISGAALRVQVCGRNPALFFSCADKPPAYRHNRRIVFILFFYKFT